MDAPPPVQYVTTSDGYNIAYGVSGHGPPIVVLPWAFEHVQLAWQYPVLGSWLSLLATRFTVVQLDTRGSGMSSRSLAPEFVFDHFQRDVEAVVKRLGLDHVVFWGVAAGCAIAARYAVENPQSVAALIFSTPASRPGAPALWSGLPEQDWGTFLHSVVPRDRSPTEARDQVDLLKQSFDQEAFVRRIRSPIGTGFSDLLRRLDTPTLVLHARDYVFIDAADSMRSAQLARASMTLIDGSYIFGDADQGIRAVDDFLAGLNPGHERPRGESGLSQREVEVLRLLAAGRSNQQIADQLVISLNTANRHVSNIYAKTGAANRVEAATYAARHGIA